MLNDFFTFNVNGINNIAFLLQSNLAFIFIMIGVVGIAFMRMKYEIDNSVAEEEAIL